MPVVHRVIAVLGASAALTLVPVVTLPWAQAQPVAPTVHRTPIAGVDDSALTRAPAALDPKALAPGKGVTPAAGPLGRASGSSRPTVFTTEVSPGPFTAAGVSWTAAGPTGDVTVQVRIREKGTWSDWQSLDSDDGPDGGSVDLAHAGDRQATAPVLTAGADAVQVRVDTPQQRTPKDLTLVTVDAGSSAADANLSGAPAASAHGVAIRPTIITRAQWGADESLRDCTPGYATTVKVGIVHHTVNSNDYTAAQSAALVRSIYAYHVQGNGWCDIGYNFLVDKYGQIFEGRYGGIDRPVVGAQAGGFNMGSTGVAGIGTFDSSYPTSPMKDGIARVLGWKLFLDGVQPTGNTFLASAGGPYTQWAAGAIVQLRNVSGHRDVDSTGCPGDLLYPQIDALRSSAQGYATQNEARLSVPGSLQPGGSVRSPNGQRTLTMRTDGNLVVTDGSGRVTWQSDTHVPYTWLAVQPDGNAVLYESLDAFPLWATNTGGSGVHLDIQDDGNLVLYASSGAPRWDSAGWTGHAASTLRPWKVALTRLGPDQRITSTDGQRFVTMQRDGNLVEYRANGSPVWASGTGIPGSFVVTQGDGNLVVYGPDNRALWASDVYNPGTYTVLQNDGNLVQYDVTGVPRFDSQGWTGNVGRRLY